MSVEAKERFLEIAKGEGRGRPAPPDAPPALENCRECGRLPRWDALPAGDVKIHCVDECPAEPIYAVTVEKAIAAWNEENSCPEGAGSLPPGTMAATAKVLPARGDATRMGHEAVASAFAEATARQGAASLPETDAEDARAPADPGLKILCRCGKCGRFFYDETGEPVVFSRDTFVGVLRSAVNGMKEFTCGDCAPPARGETTSGGGYREPYADD